MKKTIQSLFAILTILNVGSAHAFFGSKPGPKPGDEVYEIKGLTFQKQEKNQWCWAAVSRVLLSSKVSKEELPSQCEIVSKVKGKNCCNQRVLPFGCNEPNSLEAVEKKFPLAAFEGQVAQKAVRDWRKTDYSGFHLIFNSIKEGRLGFVVVDYPSPDMNLGGQHVLVAFGAYKKPNGTQYVVTWDPYSTKVQHWKKEEIDLNVRWRWVYVNK